jgi:hypothetical protein
MADNPQNQDLKIEGPGEVQDYYTIDATDSDLVKMINRKIKPSKEYEDFKKEGKNNERYWSRDHLKQLSLRWHQSRIIQNVIYMGVETIVPIMTSKPAEPVISIAGQDELEDEDVRWFTDNLQKVLLNKYYDEDYPQQALIEMLARHLLLYKIGVAKPIWYDDIDDYVIEYVNPHKIIFEQEGYYLQDICIPQYLEKTLSELIDMFPEKEKELLTAVFPGVTVSLDEYGDTPIGFWEYWTDDGEYVVWKMQNVILQKKLNPLLIWDDKKEFDKALNHFDYPHKPYIVLNSQNLGKHIWDDTSPVSQVIPIQDGINLMQRILTDTSRDQGILVGANDLIDRDELSKYTGAPDDKLSVKGGEAARALYRVPPKQLAPYVENNLMHLINMADNIMGTHSTTRGERSKNGTLGQDELAKESDYGRIDQMVRGIERLMAGIYNWEVQIMLAKYTPDHYARVLGQEKGKKLFDMMQHYNQLGIKIVIKPGSTLPTDKGTQRDEAITLSKLGKMSDIDLYKRLDFPDPQDMAENNFLQQMAPLVLYPNVIDKMNQMPMINLPPYPKLTERINVDIPYKDAPPDVQREMEQKAGFQPSQMPPLQQQPQPTQAGQPGQPQSGAPQPLQAQPQAAPGPQPNQVPVPGQQPQAGVSPIGQTGQSPQMAQTQPPIEPINHIEEILKGMDVQPFQDIPPEQWEQHVQDEFAFIAKPEYLHLPEEFQTKIAQHVLAERQLMQQQGGGNI